MCLVGEAGIFKNAMVFYGVAIWTENSYANRTSEFECWQWNLDGFVQD